MAESADRSHLDLKYFIDQYQYNCPFCSRRRVSYTLDDVASFNWSRDKICTVYIVKCDSCATSSMHLSFTNAWRYDVTGDRVFLPGIDLDSIMFYSVPTSFFVLDNRIPAVIRELIAEAETCRKLNLLTGASGCVCKAVYEFLVKEGAKGDRYEDKIGWLKARFPNVAPDLFDALGHVQDMTGDKVHEQSWPKLDSRSLALIVQTLKAVLHEVYVVPEEEAGRSCKIRDLLQKMRGNTEPVPAAEPAQPAKV